MTALFSVLLLFGLGLLILLAELLGLFLPLLPVRARVSVFPERKMTKNDKK